MVKLFIFALQTLMLQITFLNLILSLSVFKINTNYYLVFFMLTSTCEHHIQKIKILFRKQASVY